MEETQRYSLALSKLGFAHKGSFDLAEHDFALDNCVSIGNACVVLTLDSIQVFNCKAQEYWEVESNDYFEDDDLLDNTINTLKKLQCVESVPTAMSTPE